MSFTVDLRSNVAEVCINGQRPYSTYSKGRTCLSKDFERPVTKREWWRFYLKETPAPGAYEARGFVDDLAINRATYNFKGSGRRRKLKLPEGRGEMLMPGAYQHRDFIHLMSVRPLTYRFKSPARDHPSSLPAGYRDKDCTVPPNRYRVEPRPVAKQPVSGGNFKSQSARFPTKYFKPREGPSPDRYHPRDVSKSAVISSSFISRTPRFASSRTKVPGPATYAPSIQAPQSKTLVKMGRVHGLYFKNHFEM